MVGREVRVRALVMGVCGIGSGVGDILVALTLKIYFLVSHIFQQTGIEGIAKQICYVVKV